MAAKEPTLEKDGPGVGAGGGGQGSKPSILGRPEGARARGDRDIAFG